MKNIILFSLPILIIMAAIYFLTGTEEAKTVKIYEGLDKVIINEDLRSAIVSFAERLDSINQAEIHHIRNVIEIEFPVIENKCIVSLQGYTYYSTETASHFFVMDDKLLVLIKNKNDCMEKYINKNNMQPGYPSGFSDQNSREARVIWDLFIYDFYEIDMEGNMTPFNPNRGFQKTEEYDNDTGQYSRTSE